MFNVLLYLSHNTICHTGVCVCLVDEVHQCELSRGLYDLCEIFYFLFYSFRHLDCKLQKKNHFKGVDKEYNKNVRLVLFQVYNYNCLE